MSRYSVCGGRGWKGEGCGRPGAAQRICFGLQVLCFLGSLLEPFDTVLPAKHPLRFLVDQVQHARRAFEVKHGLEGLRTPMSFFDEADDDEGGDGEDDGDDGDAVDAAEAAEAGEEAQGEATAESADQESSEE